MTEETEDERRTRSARDEQHQRATQLSLTDAGGLLSKLGSLVGQVFNWGVPALLIGGLVLGFAGPISTIIRGFSPEWADKFLDFTEYAKDWINTKTGRTIFTVDEARLEAAKRSYVASNPDILRNAIASKLGTAMAEAIVPDQQASEEIVNNFLPSQNLTITQLERNPELFTQPQVLTAFIRNYPQTMQRVVATLPQGGAGAVGQVPAEIKAPLKQLLGNPQSLQAMLNDPRHAQWIIPAVARLGGESAATAFNAMRSNPPQLAGLITDMIDGVPVQQALERAKQHGPLPDVIRELAYEEAKKHEVYGPMIAAIEAKDPSFATELQAVLERTTDAKQIGEQVLAMITSNPARIQALKDLTPEQLAPIMGALGVTLKDEQAILFADKTVRDGAVDMLASFARTNSAGKNELGALLAAVSTPEGDSVTRAAEVARYIQNNPARQQAMQAFATTLENTGNGRGILPAQEGRAAVNLKDLYAANARALRELSDAPQRVLELEKIHAALPVNLKPITEGMMQGGPTYLTGLLVDDEQRAVLNQDTNGRKNLYHIGDAFRQADLATLGVASSPLSALLTPAADRSYPNLDTLVASITAVDERTGLKVDDSITVAQQMHQLEQNPAALTPEAAASLRVNDEAELNSDRANLNMLAFIQGIRGAKLQSGTGENAVYRVETMLGPIDQTPTQIASHFRTNDVLLQQLATVANSNIIGLDDATKQAVAAAGARLWNDKNGNGVIDAGEGAAAVFKNPTELAAMMNVLAGTNTGSVAASTTLWGAAGEAFASMFLSDDLKDMRAIAAQFQNTGTKTDGQSVASAQAPGDTNRLGHQNGVAAMGFGAGRLL